MFGRRPPEPPPALRDHLKRIVGQAATRSRRVYTHKGTPARDASHVPIWRRQDLRDGMATWTLNREHPLVAAALQEGASAATVRTLLDMTERLLPIHDIHVHLTNDLPVEETGRIDDLEAVAAQFLSAFNDDEETRSRLLATLHLIEPFSREPEHAQPDCRKNEPLMPTTPDMLINMTVAALNLATLPTEAEIDAVLDRLTGAFPVDAEIREQVRRTLHSRFDIRMDLGSTLLSHDDHTPWLAGRRSDISMVLLAALSGDAAEGRLATNGVGHTRSNYRRTARPAGQSVRTRSVEAARLGYG